MKALGVEEWKLREVHSSSERELDGELVSAKTLPIVCHVLSFGAFRLCFHELDETFLVKQIWRDIAKFVVGTARAETIQKHEIFPSSSGEQSIPLDPPPRLIDRVFMEATGVLFFGLLWPEICPEIADLGHMDKKKIGASNVLLLRSVEEFIKTPVQKKQVMTILEGWR